MQQYTSQGNKSDIRIYIWYSQLKKSGINHDLTHEFEKASKSLFNKAFAIKMPGLKIGGGGGRSVPQGSSSNYYSTKAMWISLFGWKKLPQSGQ